MRSKVCRSSTTLIYILSGTDFDPKGTISEVRVYARPHLDILDADRSPNADSPRSSQNRLITIIKTKKECLTYSRALYVEKSTFDEFLFTGRNFF